MENHKVYIDLNYDRGELAKTVNIKITRGNIHIFSSQKINRTQICEVYSFEGQHQSSLV